MALNPRTQTAPTRCGHLLGLLGCQVRKGHLACLDPQDRLVRPALTTTRRPTWRSSAALLGPKGLLDHQATEAPRDQGALVGLQGIRALEVILPRSRSSSLRA